MSQLLHETFDEMADEVVGAQAPTGVAGQAWRTGRRRVVRRRVGQSAAAALALIVVAALVWQPRLPQALDPAGSGEVATSHPLRVTKPWLVRGLPATGRPLAALALSAPDQDPFGSSSWLAIDVAGDVFALPSGLLVDTSMPAVSPDGRHVAYGDKDTKAFVMRDVVDGTRHVVAGLTSVYPDTQTGTWTGPAVVGSQVPVYWSPDGRRLAARVTRGDGAEALAVISTDGSMSTIPWPGAPLLAGWVDDDRVLAVAAGDGTVSKVSVATVDVGSGTRHDLPALQPEVPFRDTEISQWSPALSLDGRRLAMTRSATDDDPAVIAWSTFDVATGAEQGNGQYATDRKVGMGSTVSQLQWRGDDVLASIPTDYGTVIGPGEAPNTATMLVDPRLHAQLLLPAQRALAGPASSSVWGHSTNWWVWRWKEVLAGLLAVAVLAALRWRLAARGQA